MAYHPGACLARRLTAKHGAIDPSPRPMGGSPISTEPYRHCNLNVCGTLRPLFEGLLMLFKGFTRATAAAALHAGRAEMIASGQAYIANPDLAERFRAGHMIARSDAPTYYAQGYRLSGICDVLSRAHAVS